MDHSSEINVGQGQYCSIVRTHIHNVRCDACPRLTLSGVRCDVIIHWCHLVSGGHYSGAGFHPRQRRRRLTGYHKCGWCWLTNNSLFTVVVQHIGDVSCHITCRCLQSVRSTILLLVSLAPCKWQTVTLVFELSLTHAQSRKGSRVKIPNCPAFAGRTFTAAEELT